MASLVLGILWLGGMGSILAIIFGASARKTIRRSAGWVTGDGLAISGLVLGCVGLIGAIVFYVGVGVAASHISKELHQSVNTEVVAMGQTISTPSALDGGLASLTVYSLEFPLSASGHIGPPAGDLLAAADVKLCAGPEGARIDFLRSDMVMTSINGDQGSLTPIPTTAGSSMDLDQPLAANQCLRGHLSFQYQNGDTPSGVNYSIAPFESYEWLSAPPP